MKYLNAPRRQAGISLIEALIALAIMAVGMLGIVGVQSTLRSTSDVAKQRGEAIRIAQAEIERWRAFTALTGPGTNDYDDLTAGSTPLAAIPGINALYARNRVVSDLPFPRVGKSISVTVSWNDRSGTAQSVQLSSLIAGVTPEFRLGAVVPGAGDLFQQTKGRISGIPIGAKNLGGGKSGFVPPGSPAGTAWVFDNATGMITLCTTTVSSTDALILNPLNPASDNITCVSGAAIARYIGGYLRYALGTSQPTSAQAQSPPSSPLDAPASGTVTVSVLYDPGFTVDCFLEQIIGTPAAPSSYTAYHCAVPVTPGPPGVEPFWGGKVVFGTAATMATSLADVADDRVKACRYHAAATYSLQVAPLSNQNFLFTRGGNGSSTLPVAYTCPTPTLPHQPAT